MKKILFVILLFSPFTLLHFQLSGDLFGTPYSFSRPVMEGSGGREGRGWTIDKSTSTFALMSYECCSGNLFGTPYSFSKPTMGGSGGGGGEGWNIDKTTSTYKAPTSKVIITEAYDKKAAESYSKGVKAWNKRNWNEAIKFFKIAVAFNPRNLAYQSALSQAKGLRQWDAGVEEANKKNWDKAIGLYKEALEYFPNDNILKNNIIACSHNKTLELAEKYFNKGDCLNAAVHYNVLWKNFGDNSSLTQSRYSDCYTKISNMKKSEQALLKFNSKLDEIKKDLPFVNSGW